MTGMFTLDYTLAQMVDVITVAHTMGQHFPLTLEMADVALIISDATGTPIEDVAKGLQRLDEWRSQNDT